MNIRTDLTGMRIHNNQRVVSNKVQEAMNRLSTGLRINSANDDSAGLSISERLKSQIRGSNQAKRNIQDAISLSKTADGSLVVIQDQLQRMRELTIQAKNETLSLNDKSSIQEEINQLVKSIDNIAAKQKFNEIPILNDPKGIALSTGSAIVDVGDSDLYDMKQFTLESVVKPNNILGQKSLITKEGSWKYRITNEDVLIAIETKGDPIWDQVFTWNTNLKPDETYNITVTYDSINLKSELFVNGTSYGVKTFADPRIHYNNSPLQIGSFGNSPTERFDGIFKEARVYNEILSTDQIKQNYEGTKREMD